MSRNVITAFTLECIVVLRCRPLMFQDICLTVMAVAITIIFTNLPLCASWAVVINCIHLDDFMTYV